MEKFLPFGGLNIKNGVMFFFKELPEKIVWKKPVLQEFNDEIYAFIGEGIYIPIEKLPLEDIINNNAGIIILALINEQNFLAKTLYTIELQKETALELYALIKAKSLIT
ncbi:hypothetical protein QI155_10520 [Thermodesulfovibrio sp. 1176]|uniref:hypothetical protein n=1 Tax=Thermodesulfovibrio sp. 1176 TaxID=3043424 RepID=UPI002482AAC3|nr:hypothetical protein [Thermodesulfovibrio sp. 1176]MDI1472965.1 hypothetical protein [Thermodesulfovibrio sp. 1176]